MKTALVLIVITLFMSFGCAANAQNTADAPQFLGALGIAMETIDYPYPVHFLPLHIEGQDLRMAYMDVKPTGTSGGQTVLLLHGKNFWGAYWSQTIAALADAGFRVVVPDQIGFGKSSKPDIHYTFDLLAANTMKVLDEIGVQKFTVVGHSMGGMLATRIALKYPDRVQHLVLENPIGLEDYRMAGVPVPPLEKLYENELNKKPAAIQAYIKTYFPDGVWNDDWAIYGLVPSRMKSSGEWPRFAMASALTYQMILEQPVCHEFSQVQEPTLLVIGQADRTAVGKNLVSKDVATKLGRYPQLGRRTHDAIPNSKLIELDGVGHIPHLQVTERFNRILIDYLSSK